MKKTIILIQLCFICISLYPQKWNCSTESPQTDLLVDQLKITSYNTLLRSSSNNSRKNIAVFCHIVRNSSGRGGLSEFDVDRSMNKLRQDYERYNVGFIEIGRDFINDDIFIDEEKIGTYFSTLVRRNFQSKAINIYFLPGTSTFARSAGIPGLALVFGGGYAGTSVLSHEIGHCLGLYHTHSGSGCFDYANCKESIDGSNCASCGDLVCDTPADPCLSGIVDFSCRYVGGMGYNPDALNIMSYSSPQCLSRLTVGQVARMHTMIENSIDLQSALIPMIEGPNFLCKEASYSVNDPHATVQSWELSSNPGLLQLQPSNGNRTVTITSYQFMNITTTLYANVLFANGKLERFSKEIKTENYSEAKGTVSYGSTKLPLTYPTNLPLNTPVTIIFDNVNEDLNLELLSTGGLPIEWKYSKLNKKLDLKILTSTTGPSIYFVFKGKGACLDNKQLWFRSSFSLNKYAVSLNSTNSVLDIFYTDQPDANSFLRTSTSVLDESENIDLQKQSFIKHIQIYNIMGNLILDKKINNENQIQVDISKLNTGNYILNIFDGVEWQRTKFIKK